MFLSLYLVLCLKTHRAVQIICPGQYCPFLTKDLYKFSFIFLILKIEKKTEDC